MFRRFFCWVVLFGIVPCYPLLKKIKRYKTQIDDAYFLIFKTILPNDRIECIKMGELFGSILYYFKVSDKYIRVNMRIVYGDTKTETEKSRLRKKIYRFIGSIFFESFYLSGASEEDIRSITTIDDLKMLEKINREQTQTGLIFLSAHAGSIDVCPMALPLYVSKFMAYTTIQSPIIESHLEKTRTKLGTIIVKKSRWSSLTLLKGLKKNHIIGLMADMDYKEAIVFHPFFSEKASVASGIYYFPQKKNVPIYFVYTVRDSNYLYRYHIKQIPVDYSSGDDEAIKETIVKQYFKALETLLLKYPEQQYLWLYKRWKTRPPEEKGKNLYG